MTSARFDLLPLRTATLGELLRFGAAFAVAALDFARDFFLTLLGFSLCAFGLLLGFVLTPFAGAASLTRRDISLRRGR